LESYYIISEKAELSSIAYIELLSFVLSFISIFSVIASIVII